MSKALGQIGEDLAVEFLETEGYTVLARNFRIRSGEIDIIAERKGDIHFIEVKSRKNTDYGDPAEFVTRTKMRRITKTAEYFIHTNRLYDRNVQIDVVAITAGTIDFIENVF